MKCTAWKKRELSKEEGTERGMNIRRGVTKGSCGLPRGQGRHRVGKKGKRGASRKRKESGRIIRHICSKCIQGEFERERRFKVKKERGGTRNRFGSQEDET